jgi:hydrogenase nickel incorporation protein HypA/HybF
LHELSICQSLIDQLEALARKRGAVGVARVEVEVGLLSGVEARLLESAFEIARTGTIAAEAALMTRTVSLRARCLSCGAEFEAAISDLRCAHCEAARTEVIRGRDLILARAELVMEKVSDAVEGQDNVQ